MSLLHEYAAGYALDALEAGERREFEAHLAACVVCRGEVATLCETAAELSLLSLAIPPPDLRTAILDVIRTTPQAPVLVSAAAAGPPVRTDGTTPAVGVGSHPAGRNGRHRPEHPDPPARPTGPRRAAFDPERSDGAAPPVDELARRRTRTRVLSGLLVALVVLAAGLGGVVGTLVQDRQRQAAQVAREDQLYQARDTVARTTRLAGGGQVTFIASRQLDRALVIGTGLPDPGPNRYQLWTGTEDLATRTTVPVRDTQVGAVARGIKVFFSGHIADSDFLAVNLEPAGSAPTAPTTEVLAAASI